MCLYFGLVRWLCHEKKSSEVTFGNLGDQDVWDQHDDFTDTSNAELDQTVEEPLHAERISRVFRFQRYVLH
jgi:hypothetical protein